MKKKFVSKSSLKAKMFEYFRELEEKGGDLIVTDFGKPVLKVVPYTEKRTITECFGDLRGKARLPRREVLAGTEEEWSEV